MNHISSSIDERGKYVPWVIIAFFVTFILLLSSFVWIAFAHKPSLVTENAYQKGLAYNEALSKAADQNKLGWVGDVSIVDGKNITLTLKDAKRIPISGATVKAWIIRPSSAAMDKEITLSSVSAGQYSAALKLAGPGLWEAHVTALYQGKQFQFSKSFEAE